MTVLPYRTPATARLDARSRVLRVFGVLVCVLMLAGNAWMLSVAAIEYRGAVAAPGKRVTPAERVERLLVRTERGLGKVYANRQLYVAACVATIVRMVAHGLLLLTLWRRTSVRSPAWLLMLTTPLVLVAWTMFVGNLRAVDHSFALLDNLLEGWTMLIGGIYLGVFLASLLPLWLLSTSQPRGTDALAQD